MGYWVRTGTLSVENGSTAVTGTLTGWTSTVRAGDLLFAGNNPPVEIGEVGDDNVTITLVEPWPFTTISDGTYAIAQGLLWGDVTRLANEVANALANQSEILGGIGAPEDSLGGDGSRYFQDDEPLYYVKNGTSWGDPISLEGPAGPTGAKNIATSTTSRTIGSTGTMSFTVEAGLSIQANMRMRAANSSSNYMEGAVASYSGTSLSITMDRSVGSGTFTSWTISPVGDKGDKGDTGPSYGGSSTSSLAIGTGTKVVAIGTGYAYVLNQRVRIANDASNYMEGTVSGYSSGNLTVSVDRVVGSGTFSSWTVGITGDRGATGATGIQGPNGAPNVLSIGTVTQGAAAATITGTSPTQTLNLTIPKGDTGATGATGAKGDKGDTGDQGDQGEQGIPGTSFEPDARGTFAERDAHDDEIAGFGYLSIDGDGDALTVACLFFKNTSATADWSSPTPFQGPKGDTGEQGEQGEKGDQGDPGTTDFNELTNKPTLGTAAAQDVGYFATAAQGALADSALQPSGIASTIHAATGKSTPVDADELGLVDSAASNVLKKLTWANVKATLTTYFDTLYQPVASALTSWGGVTRASGFDTFAATPSSANLRALLTDEVGTGVAYFVGGALGTPASGSLDNCTTNTGSARSNATQLASEAYADAQVDASTLINTRTASYTAVLADKGYTVEMNVASANTFTIPPNSSVAFPVGTYINVSQIGAGQTTLTPGSGVTINSRNGLNLGGQHAMATLYKRATDTWQAGGDLTS